MNELHHLADTLHRAYAGDAWHGPSLSEALEGVDFKQAAERLGESHSIWELTLHIEAWIDISRRRLEGERLTEADISWDDNWPKTPEITAENWALTKKSTCESCERLCMTIREFPEARLDETVPGRDYSFAVMLHGTTQHLLYHTGQISLLRRLRS